MEVKKVDALTTSVTFSPNSPSLPASANSYRVNSYYVQCRFKDAEWSNICQEALPNTEALQSVEEVLVKSLLSVEPRRCEYRVTMCYDYSKVGEVRSEILTQSVEVLGKHVFFKCSACWHV